MSTTTPNLNLFKYDVSTDSNVAFSITEALNNNWDIIDAKCGQSNNILDFKWSDHLLNDMSWLRADTFSWQDGNTYSLAYNELLSEYNNSASTTKTEGSITFKRTPKGYKIALLTQETAIAEKYATDGIAWYYILDTTNKKFKLPRTKFGFEGLRTSVGDDIEAGLPNIEGSFHFEAVKNTLEATGAFTLTTYNTKGNHVAGSDTKEATMSLDVSRSNPIYGNSDTVQPPATQMYLYFYVGNFTKSAETQTAGLKAELLNGKADVDTPSIKAPYIKTAYKNGTSWYRVWSDGWCEQGGILTVSGTSQVITFLKPYINTNYIIIYANGYNSAPSGTHLVCFGNKTTNSITRFGSSSWKLTYWKTEGYII